MGSSASKAALRATTDEPTEPEPKHLADLIQYINGTNMSVKQMADTLSEQTRSSSWMVVFKALVTVHHLMVYGNERFIKHLASRNSLFTLHNFLDNSVIEGCAMSPFIRRYSRYLTEKSIAYRQCATDITKTRRGVMRTMNTRQLLNTIPAIQIQFDALLNFNANPEDLTNGIIRAAFMLLFKDSLRLFAAYNEGILNILDKYFDMRKYQCKESLDIYIKFLGKKTKLAQFLQVAKQIGIDQSGIPHLTQASDSVLQALQQHLAHLEVKPNFVHNSGFQHALIPSIPYTPAVTNSASNGGFTVGFSADNILRPTLSSPTNNHVQTRQQDGAIKANDLDRPLANCVRPNDNFGEVPVNRFDVKWSQPSETEINGGTGYQLNTYTFISTTYDPVSVPSVTQHGGSCLSEEINIHRLKSMKHSGSTKEAAVLVEEAKFKDSNS